MNHEAPKILVIRGGAIGDFILTLPVLRALRENFPQASLEVLGYPHIARLAQEGGLVHHVEPIESRAMAGFFVAGDRPLDLELSRFFSQFALIISYLYDPDQIFVGNVKRCSGAQFIQGPHRPEPGNPLHAAKVFLEPLERLAIFDFDFVPQIALPETSIESFSGRWLALHPGSGSVRKNWPLPFWEELLQRVLGETTFNVLLVAGEAEGESVGSLASHLPPDRGRAAIQLPLWQLGGLLQKCAGFVGHDSGITHLAAALGLPALVLWGESLEHIWRPPNDRVTILRAAAGLQHLGVSDVFEVVWEKFEARDCFRPS